MRLAHKLCREWKNFIKHSEQNDGNAVWKPPYLSSPKILYLQLLARYLPHKCQTGTKLVLFVEVQTEFDDINYHSILFYPTSLLSFFLLFLQSLYIFRFIEKPKKKMVKFQLKWRSNKDEQRTFSSYNLFINSVEDTVKLFLLYVAKDHAKPFD